MKGELLVYQSFIPRVSAPCHYRISTQIGCPTLPLACELYCIIYITRVLHFASWGVFIYVGPLFRILGCNMHVKIFCAKFTDLAAVVAQSATSSIQQY